MEWFPKSFKSPLKKGEGLIDAACYICVFTAHNSTLLHESSNKARIQLKYRPNRSILCRWKKSWWNSLNLRATEEICSSKLYFISKCSIFRDAWRTITKKLEIYFTFYHDNTYSIELFCFFFKSKKRMSRLKYIDEIKRKQRKYTTIARI